MFRASLLVLAAVAAVSFAALPPGHDEELYCPAGHCLAKKTVPQGFVGPRKAFHKCWDQATQKSEEPSAWGNKIDQAVKDKLLADKFHTDTCEKTLTPDQLTAMAAIAVKEKAVSDLPSVATPKQPAGEEEEEEEHHDDEGEEEEEEEHDDSYYEDDSHEEDADHEEDEGESEDHEESGEEGEDHEGEADGESDEDSDADQEEGEEEEEEHQSEDEL